jgi:hypothetical protein
MATLAPATTTRPAPAARRQRLQAAALLLLAAAFIAIRFWNLTSFCLDADEIFSVLCARFGLGGLLHAVRVDVVHPPLWYLLLAVWVRVGGESLLWLRLLPCLLSILALAPLWILFRQWRLPASAQMMALALLAVNDYQVFHARYVRMYALLLLLGLASAAVFNAFLERATRRRALALAAVNLLLVYTHYFGWMVVAVEGLHLLWMDRGKLKPFLPGAVVDGLLFAPWAIGAMQAAIAKGGLAANLGWIRHPGIDDVLWYYTGCNGPFWPIPVASTMLYVLLGVMAAGLWQVFRHTSSALEASRLRFLALLAMVPPAATYLLSNMLPESVWGNRHMIVSTIPYLILLAMAIAALRPKWIRYLVMVITAAWICWGAYRVTNYPEPRNNLDVLTGQLVALNASQGARGQATIYFLDPYLSFPMRYYLETHYHRKWKLVDVSDPHAVSGDRFWVAYNHKSWKGPGHPQDVMRRLGYQIGPGVWAGDRWDRIGVFLAYRRSGGPPRL